MTQQSSNPDFAKRSLLAAALALASLSFSPFAAAAPVSQGDAASAQPFREITKPIAEHRKHVIVFFSYNCSVCRTYHAALERWGASLPPDWTFEMVPAVTLDRDTQMAAQVYYAVRRQAPEKLSALSAAAYPLIQDRSMSALDTATWMTAARSAQIENLPQMAAVSERKLLERSVRLLSDYAVTATPSIAIGGRYVITPDNTNGNGDLFFKLANGMVSKAIQGR